MIYSKFYFLMAISLFLIGCGPGASDYAEKIRGTELMYIDNNSLNRIIVKLNSNGEQETLIGSSILSYQVEGNHLVGARQVVNHYICDSTRSDVEITDHIEFFAINIPAEGTQYSSSLFDTFAGFKKHLESVNIDDQVVNDFQPKSFEDKLLTVNSLGECKNAKLIANKNVEHP